MTLNCKRILLAILPYWAPVLPPVGLARLKSFLQHHGYEVKIIDFIVKNEALEFYYDYFDVLKACIPGEKRGNFKNIGHDVLRNHMMAHIHYQDEEEYIQLVKVLIYKSYYVQVEDAYIRQLNEILTRYYKILEEYFLFELEFEEPDVVGLTVYKDTVAPSLFVLKLTREKYPHIKTVIGGGIFADSHIKGSPNYERLLEVTAGFVDKIIIGEGELLFLKYLRGELPAFQRVYTREDIDGEVLDLKDARPPDFSDLNIRKYSHLPGTASFSCPYNCSFCNERQFRGKYRKRDIKDTVDEMVELYNAVELNNVNSGHQLFFMTDSLLNPIIDDLAHELIKRKVSLYYDGYYKVDQAAADANKTFSWRKSGLYRVRLGVESGSRKVLNLMRKGITVEQIRSAVSNFALAGIKTTTYWVIGHPGETEADFQQTLDLVTQLRNCIYQAECNPFLYHYMGQNSSDEWKERRKRLYPEKARDMLIFDSWTLDMEPVREVAYQRMHRFEKHCRSLGIPNPYSFKEIFDADGRWKKVQKFAVPSLNEFNEEGKFIRDNFNNRIFVKKECQEEGDFDL
ncbi:MAG: radical SAM protein [Candidatus Aminicenantes bacterium]|nr:radical SAM protein [Candidatus Aminicenantes bacterium]NIM82447.1 radical SAM protein [Candidatus Aminicenantes bacterium]NIN21808.1 radical SAM protein [Candidatus Aminicenantes bacterium]NIN45600.1 radical SAM protein [Candidatus Aminicenantes bacterium]NIN88431.1 radical SAM protein [Candidatus Aminicenantes bacterium]